jgi:hypothetical protein
MTSAPKKQLAVGGALAALFCVGGAALAWWGWARYAATRAFVAKAAAAEGEVVGFETYDPPGGTSVRDRIHYALVRYETAGGREVRFRGPSRDGPVRLRQGQTVRVLYDPDDPTEARVDSFMGLWFAPTLLWMLGGGAILIPLLTLWQAWKWAKRQEEASA